MSETTRPDRAPPPAPPAPEPAEGAAGFLAALLKAPRAAGEAIARGPNPVALGLKYLAAAAVFHALFGVAAGLFGGLETALMAAAKGPLIALGSLGLCLPSLYVFGSLGGATLSLARTFALGAACLAMTGILLVGLAPVAWLFAVSTESLPFVVFLVAAVWVVSVSFAGRMLGKIGVRDLSPTSLTIEAWFLVFVLVSAQMTTCLRPVLTPPSRGWWTGEKMFFLSHFASCFERTPADTEGRKGK
ncbi:MAG: hypothetical protein MUC63_06535 [Planctomycetes bacterium]|jgi:hypothetical protein|nr:hypothetical protein [Planctomycetota bacterium]